MALVGSYELCMWIAHRSYRTALTAPERVPDADPLPAQAVEAFAGRLAEGHVPNIRTKVQVRAYLSELTTNTS